VTLGRFLHGRITRVTHDKESDENGFRTSRRQIRAQVPIDAPALVTHQSIQVPRGTDRRTWRTPMDAAIIQLPSPARVVPPSPTIALLLDETARSLSTPLHKISDTLRKIAVRLKAPQT